MPPKRDALKSYIEAWEARTGRSYVGAPSILYKYRSLQGNHLEHVRQSIQEQRVCFSSPNKVNDIFDGKVRMNIVLSRRQAKKLFDRGLKKQGVPRRDRQKRVSQAVRERRHETPALHKEMTDFMQRKFDTLSMFCLSEVSDEILMWSYYADGHAGVCLGFDPPAIANIRDPSTLALPITYRKRYIIPEIRTYPDDVEDMWPEILLTKAEEWSHEREWRIIDMEGNPGTRQIPRGALVEIILGAAISPENQDRICQWATSIDPQPRLFKARPSDSEFALMVEPLE